MIIKWSCNLSVLLLYIDGLYSIFNLVIFLAPGKSKGTDGQECALLCPVNCDDDEILCPGDVLTNGCKENDYCHPKGTGNDGIICPF